MMTSINFQIKEETTDTDIMNECNYDTIDDSVEHNNIKTIREAKNYEPEAKTKTEEEQIYVTEVDISYEKYPIKSEPVDEEQEETDKSYIFTYKVAGEDIKIEMKSEDAVLHEEKFENTVKKEIMCAERVSFNNKTNKEMLYPIKQSEFPEKSSTEVQVIRSDNKIPKTGAQINKEYHETQKIKKQAKLPSTSRSRAEYMKEYRRKMKLKDQSIQLNTLQTKHHSEQRIQNDSEFERSDFQGDIQSTIADYKQRTSTTLSHCKEFFIVGEEQLTDSASSTKYDENDYHSTIKDRIILEDYSYVSDPCNISQTTSTWTSNVNSNNLTPNDAESLENLFICDICNKRFHCKSTLMRHILKHPKMHNCTYCSYKTIRKFDLNMHINSQHTKSTVFNCSYCSFNTCQKMTLHQHINAKHTKNNVFICPYCSLETYKKGDLERHINYKHTKSVVFNCSYCNYKAYHKYTLNQHVNAKHTKSTIFNCSYCSYKAYQKCNLNRHINSQHTKSTVFKCSFCIFKTYEKSGLDQHINSKHTKSTVFNCSYCSYKAHKKCHIDQHINSQHTKSTVFSCSYCSYKSFYKHKLSKHVKVKHSQST